MEEIIANGIRRGVLKDVDPHLATLATFGMCNWAYQWYRPGGPLKPREIAEHFWGYLVCGIGTESLVDSISSESEPR